MATSLQRIVYILKNADAPPRFYTGVTADLAARLEAHNAGRCSHTAKHRPWVVDVIVKFADEHRALKFEKYLKSGSGVEFARRHLR
jgi:putative endonuclease